jgi:hypothetical protein
MLRRVSLSARLQELATRTLIRSRDATWRLYERMFPPRPGGRVFDVVDLAGENYFLRRYPFLGQPTGVGISDLSGLSLRYPDVAFVQADGRELPFEDDEVRRRALERRRGARRAAKGAGSFVAELIRVAKRGIITAPQPAGSARVARASAACRLASAACDACPPASSRTRGLARVVAVAKRIPRAVSTADEVDDSRSKDKRLARVFLALFSKA